MRTKVVYAEKRVAVTNATAIAIVIAEKRVAVAMTIAIAVAFATAIKAGAATTQKPTAERDVGIPTVLAPRTGQGVRFLMRQGSAGAGGM